MLRAVLLTTISILAVGVAAGAQMPGANAGQMADMMNFQAAMMKAQAAAVRPGDEALGCDALGKELVTLMDSPAMKAYAARLHGAPVKQTTDTQKKQSAAGTVLPMTPAAAAAMAAALSPTPGAAPEAVAGAPTTALMTQHQQLATQQMKELTPVLPVLMRTQRLMSLLALEGCALAQ